MNEDIEPGWFLRFRNNDYNHLKQKVDRIETRVTMTWKVELIILGAILTGAIGIILAVVYRGIL